MNKAMFLYVDSNFISPYAMSAFVALSVKGVDFDVRPLDLAAGEAATTEFAECSLTSRIPTLIDGDFSLSESSAIAEYLEDLIESPRLYPTDTKAKARARQIQAWLRSDLLALRQERNTEVVFLRPTNVPLSTAGAAAADRLLRAANVLLAPNRDCIFDAWSIVDVDLALMLNRLVLNGDPVPDHLADYARRQWQHPAIQAWLKKPRPLHVV